ncbi:MAG: hypothetical protein RL011_2028 [Pseudomonadota bacterium]
MPTAQQNSRPHIAKLMGQVGEYRGFLARNRMSLVVTALIMSWLGISWIVLLFESMNPSAQIQSYPQALWWGIVTFMTVGYGDLSPITPGGRIAAGFLMFAGVLAIGIISAKISAYFLRQVLLEGRGSVDQSKTKNHFIICGWKEDMPDLLRHILRVNKALKSSEIVIIANRSQEDIAALKSDPKLAQVTVIIGDYFQQSTLQRAAPDAARKVLILADASVGPDGRKPTATEADARTIMTAIALSNIAKGTIVAAEIIDSTLDHYLKLASVSEIIYSREYSRLLLGSASSGTGLVNVFHDLVDPSTGAFITTKDISDAWHERTYGDFRRAFGKEHQDMLVIGILANTGNPHIIKELAFKEAQKTPSISTLIDNLKTVKSLRCNNPIFHPRDDYKITKGSAAIVLVNEHATDTHHQESTLLKKDRLSVLNVI